jgi:DNA polymerase-3 subunit beta
MKFIVSSTELLSHLQAISRVINAKNALPILDDFLFSLEGNTLTMTASDVETTLITSMEVEEAQGSGKVAIASRLLLDTLREFSEQPLTFSINESNLGMTITTSNGAYNFIGENADEFPRLPELEGEPCSFEMPVDNLLSGISKTLFAIAADDLREVMNGIYFDLSPKELTIVATDAHKLSRYKTTNVSTSLNEEEVNSFVLPKKPANLLKNILPRERGNVKIRFDKKYIYFELENYTLMCLQVSGKYPNYNSVIPFNNPIKIIVDRLMLLNSIRRVSVFCNQATNLIKLVFSEQQVNISAEDIDFSISAEETIPCQLEGNPITIGFKATYLIDILSNIDFSDVVIELSEPSRAALIFPLENEENEEVLMLLMPMLLMDYD